MADQWLFFTTLLLSCVWHVSELSGDSKSSALESAGWIPAIGYLVLQNPKPKGLFTVLVLAQSSRKLSELHLASGYCRDQIPQKLWELDWRTMDARLGWASI